MSLSVASPLPVFHPPNTLSLCFTIALSQISSNSSEKNLLFLVQSVAQWERNSSLRACPTCCFRWRTPSSSLRTIWTSSWNRLAGSTRSTSPSRSTWMPWGWPWVCRGCQTCVRRKRNCPLSKSPKQTLSGFMLSFSSTGHFRVLILLVGGKKQHKR